METVEENIQNIIENKGISSRIPNKVIALGICTLLSIPSCSTKNVEEEQPIAPVYDDSQSEIDSCVYELDSNALDSNAVNNLDVDEIQKSYEYEQLIDYYGDKYNNYLASSSEVQKSINNIEKINTTLEKIKNSNDIYEIEGIVKGWFNEKFEGSTELNFMFENKQSSFNKVMIRLNEEDLEDIKEFSSSFVEIMSNIPNDMLNSINTMQVWAEVGTTRSDESHLATTPYIIEEDNLNISVRNYSEQKSYDSNGLHDAISEIYLSGKNCKSLGWDESDYLFFKEYLREILYSDSLFHISQGESFNSNKYQRNMLLIDVINGKKSIQYANVELKNEYLNSIIINFTNDNNEISKIAKLYQLLGFDGVTDEIIYNILFRSISNTVNYSSPDYGYKLKQGALNGRVAKTVGLPLNKETIGVEEEFQKWEAKVGIFKPNRNLIYNHFSDAFIRQPVDSSNSIELHINFDERKIFYQYEGLNINGALKRDQLGQLNKYDKIPMQHFLKAINLFMSKQGNIKMDLITEDDISKYKFDDGFLGVHELSFFLPEDSTLLNEMYLQDILNFDNFN